MPNVGKGNLHRDPASYPPLTLEGTDSSGMLIDSRCKKLLNAALSEFLWWKQKLLILVGWTCFEWSCSAAPVHYGV
jgi:hypothetical protein